MLKLCLLLLNVNELLNLFLFKKNIILLIFDVCKCKDCVKVNFDCIFCYIDNMLF